MTLRMVRDAGADAADQQSIRDRLDQWNIDVTGHDDWLPVAIFLRDEQDHIRGGVLGDIWAAWLHVKFLWVDEDCRRHGWGAQAARGRRSGGARAGMRERPPGYLQLPGRPATSTAASDTRCSGSSTDTRRAMRTTTCGSACGSAPPRGLSGLHASW